jgi:Protein of unknown function (DUF2934)
MSPNAPIKELSIDISTTNYCDIGVLMNRKEEIIRKLAYQIWEAESQPDGQADKHWEKATIIADGISDPNQAHLKKSIDPSEASGPTEPIQPDQT